MRLTLLKLKITKFNCNNDFNSLLNFEIIDDLKVYQVNNTAMTSLLLSSKAKLII